MKQHQRNCPNCNKTLTYSSYKNLWRAKNMGTYCKDCTDKLPKKAKSKEYSRNCPECSTILYYNSLGTLRKSEGKKCNSCTQRPLSTGRLHTEETKQKISKNHAKYWTGTDGYWKNKTRSNETRKKLRLIFASKLQTRVTGSFKYNPKAVQLFEQIEREFNFNGIYATKNNLGEFYVKDLGYWVDYYEPELNLVIEYDEKHHERYKQKIKDNQRQVEIMELLKCKFIRIKEVDSMETIYNKLKEVTK
jgi:hypothetical protein